LAKEAQTFLKMVTPDGKTPTVPPEEIETALKTNPGYVPALMLRGAAAEKQGDRNAALSAYNEALRIYPAFAPAQKRLAALYSETPENRDKAYNLAVEARKTLADAPISATIVERYYQSRAYNELGWRLRIDREVRVPGSRSPKFL